MVPHTDMSQMLAENHALLKPPASSSRQDSLFLGHRAGHGTMLHDEIRPDIHRPISKRQVLTTIASSMAITAQVTCACAVESASEIGNL